MEPQSSSSFRRINSKPALQMTDDENAMQKKELQRLLHTAKDDERINLVARELSKLHEKISSEKSESKSESKSGYIEYNNDTSSDQHNGGTFEMFSISEDLILTNTNNNSNSDNSYYNHSAPKAHTVVSPSKRRNSFLDSIPEVLTYTYTF